MDDQDEGSGGRTGRVRKKSAKLLEMEEFEQAEKSSHVVKKGKTPKTPTSSLSSLDDSEGKLSGKKLKSPKVASAEVTTPTAKTAKLDGSLFSETPRAVPAELTLRTAQPETPESQDSSIAIESQLESSEFKLGSPVSSSLPSHPVPVKKEDPKSVIKYLLSSPTAGSTGAAVVAAAAATKIVVPLTPEPESLSIVTPKAIKRPKSDEKGSKSKPKEKRPKIEIMSPSELLPAPSVKSPVGTSTLKMKITEGSNPLKAQVAFDVHDLSPEAGQAAKPKKAAKKVKVKTEVETILKSGILDLTDRDESPPVKKTKVSKKKEKLIQDAISAVQQMPNLAALVAATGPAAQGLSDSLPPPVQKTQKKKIKTSPTIKSESLIMEADLPDSSFDGELEESTLVIAEKEKKKKKVLGKKKGLKEKDGSTGIKEEKNKKIPKRAPTAYMLFCNSHRPSIVAENPGIEFAGISRKLGELWQAQSNKQKLQWRRKAQRRKKKSNLISTGKTGKESQGAAVSSTISVLPANSRLTTNQKLTSLLAKSKGTLADEAPLSPTKVGIEELMTECETPNFSIEPMDVAAHLKLLGESLSIIGMRLQEHKGMIAVQGSLSVLLDSLICACGPLLCLTQQVPGMDGCSPLLHAQTLDSVAYVMPGL